MFYTFSESPYKELVKAAVQVKDKAYCPYSNFHVGAAVLTSSNQIFTGIGYASASLRFFNPLSLYACLKPIPLADVRRARFHLSITIPRGLEWNGEIVKWYNVAIM